MKITTKTISNICVMELSGEVDAEHAPELKKALTQAEAGEAEHFVLDFAKVNFIDSSGLGVLISLLRRLSESGAQLRLTNLQEEVRSIFEITRLFRVFTVSPSVEEAVKELR